VGKPFQSTFKGNGAYKRDLLVNLYKTFGDKPFTAQQAQVVQEYSKSTFRILIQDEWLLKKSSGRSPHSWIIVPDGIYEAQKVIGGPQYGSI
jgi:hypothetical protein